MEPPANLAAQRWHTIRAMAALAAARIMVRWVPFSLWRRVLGQVVEQPTDRTAMGSSDLALACFLARRVERAAQRLPGTSKCLPQAMALQWLMRRAGMPSRLVIALHRHDRASEHTFHAWVEIGGNMLIGHCERELYSPVATFDQFG